jgi:predicted nucleic acid-binding protein
LGSRFASVKKTASFISIEAVCTNARSKEAFDKVRGKRARRILADFLIGAHALHHGYGLLTFDDRRYPAAFPRPRIMTL